MCEGTNEGQSERMCVGTTLALSLFLSRGLFALWNSTLQKLVFSLLQNVQTERPLLCHVQEPYDNCCLPHWQILTLQKMGCEEGRCGFCAGQTLFQQVSLKLQGKQVSTREFKTSEISAPRVLEHTPMSPSRENTAIDAFRAKSRVTLHTPQHCTLQGAHKFLSLLLHTNSTHDFE